MQHSGLLINAASLSPHTRGPRERFNIES